MRTASSNDDGMIALIDEIAGPPQHRVRHDLGDAFRLTLPAHVGFKLGKHMSAIFVLTRGFAPSGMFWAGLKTLSSALALHPSLSALLLSVLPASGSGTSP